MNLWWEVFSVAKTALGGWFPFLLQTGSIFLAVGITLCWTSAQFESLPSHPSDQAITLIEGF
jgi:hypothetical protein